MLATPVPPALSCGVSVAVIGLRLIQSAAFGEALRLATVLGGERTTLGLIFHDAA